MRGKTFILILIIIFSFALKARAVVVTEGRIDELILDIHEDITRYKAERQKKVKKIVSLKKRLGKLQKSLKKTSNYRERHILHAQILSTSETLLEETKTTLILTRDTVAPIISKLRELKTLTYIGIEQKPSISKKKMREVFKNLARFALESNDQELKEEIAEILRGLEMTYRKNTKQDSVSKKIRKQIDGMIDCYCKIHTKTILALRQIEKQLSDIRVAKDVQKYAITLNSVRQLLREILPQDIFVIPDIELDRLIENVELPKERTVSGHDVDNTLKKYLEEGPNF